VKHVTAIDADSVRVTRGGISAVDPSVWTGRALQAGCEQMEGVVLRICIRPLHGAFVLLAIMDIRAHPISFSERP
jgi:hypothetical protein